MVLLLIDKHLPVYRQIELRLKNYIVENQLQRHCKLPSEQQLADEYRASIGTVRKALKNLIAENVIYRKHGIGTFVAPRVRKGKILIVPNQERVGELSRIDYFDFFLGALSESNQNDLPYEPLIIEIDDFRANVSDLKLIYPDLAGVIFFRGMSNCMFARKSLSIQQIPFMYYGPNIYGDLSSCFSCYYCDESAVAAMVADYFAAKGFHKVASVFLFKGSELGDARLQLFSLAASERGLRHSHYSFDDNAALMRQLGDIADENDAIYCFNDDMAVRIIQILERELHRRVPDDIAVMGVDNTPAGAVIRPALSTVEINNSANGRECIKAFADVCKPDASNFVRYCPLELIARESC